MSDNNDKDEKGKASDQGGDDKAESSGEGTAGKEDVKGRSMMDGEGSDGNLDLLEAAPGQRTRQPA